MSYSEFSLSDATKGFGLGRNEETDLFSSAPEVPPSDWLRATLDRTVPLALAIHTEKARSELIVAPFLVELRVHAKDRVSFFSGVSFDVDPARGLNGVCDFIVCRGPEQLFIEAPVLAVVEAKNDNIKGGLAQCIAEMVAAQAFNVREGTGITTVHGVVTTGSNWKFLRLTGTTVWIDVPEYYIDRAGKILGILDSIVRG
jgi:hypothetical protein